MTQHDPLEAELFALRPREVSADLRHRIAVELAATSLVQRKKGSRSFWWVGAVSGGVLALLFALVLRHGTIRTIESETHGAPLQPSIDIAFDDTLPSVWAYRIAMTQSPEALDALLDKHAIRIPEAKPGCARDFVFARFDSDLDKLIGEL